MIILCQLLTLLIGLAWSKKREVVFVFLSFLSVPLVGVKCIQCVHAVVPFT